MQAEKLKSGLADADIGIRTGEMMYSYHGNTKGKHPVKKEIQKTLATPSGATPGPSSGLGTSGEAPAISSSLTTPLSWKRVQQLDKDVEQVLEDSVAGIGNTPKFSEDGGMESVQVPSQLAENEDIPLSSTSACLSPPPENVSSPVQTTAPSG